MPLHRCIIILLLLVHQAFLTEAQQQDSSAGKKSHLQLLDSAHSAIKKFVQVDSSSLNALVPYKNLSLKKSFVRLNGGYAAYNFNYRSNIDTPFVDRNVMQHNITGQFNFTAIGILPLQVNYWVRQTNSSVFRNIADVRVSFNNYAFQNQLQALLRERLEKLPNGFADPLTEKIYGLKSKAQAELSGLMNISFSPQAIAEAYEILRVPRITWDPYVADSVNSRREDSIKKAVSDMLDLYTKTKAKYDSLSNQVDSLKKIYKQNRDKVEQVRQLLKGGWGDMLSLRNLERKLKEKGLNEPLIPKKYRWLMGIRNFSLGRGTANYSELTAKNISVNGLNFEYNSWYYFAVAAGLVNYRFRDFAVGAQSRKPQNFILVRAGIGNLQKNYFIVSAYRGQKQLFRSGVANNSLVTISGLSAESRWQLNRSTWITAEVAKSMAPDIRNNPSQYNAKLDWKDNSNQAFAFRLYSWIPVLNTRMEGFYKRAGANFQSFSNFQTNAQLESWYVKAEQNFFKRKLRIAASLRKNEFYNPFIVQDYKSNTVFKTISASLRMRKWPVVTVAYQPMSQLTKIDEVIVENRFQSLNTTLYHLYKVSGVRTASTVMYNKFYNSSSDTGFIYYNATNFYYTQHFFFKTFNTHIGASHTKNSGYSLTVLDGGIQPNIKDRGAIGIGVRVNSFNSQLVKVGGYVNANIRINKQDIIYLNYEHGYLPGYSQQLVRNEMANIQFVKNF